MWSSLILVGLVLAVVGGFIAYYGDRLGTYVGKKRISRFGLRPRHTATLYTTLSGSAIAVLTLILLVSADSAFKRALLEGPLLIAENSRYKDQIKLEKVATGAASARMEAATQKLAQAQSQLLPVQQQLNATQKALSESRRALLASRQQLNAAQQQLTIAQSSLGSTNQKLHHAQQDVFQARQRLTVADNRVALAQQRVAQQQLRLSDLTEFGKRLDTTNTRLQANIAQLQLKANRLEQRTASSQQKLIFRSEQEVGRVVIKTVQPKQVIENDLSSFLNSLGQTAEGRGATKGAWGRAVVVAVPVSPESSEYGPLSRVDEQKAIDTLAQQIQSSSTIHSVVVVARTVTNTFQGEQAYIRLQPYENALIYPKGSLVATTTISGAQTPFQIVDALGTFLTDKVRPAVLNQQLIPQIDPETGLPVIGSLDEATSQTLVQQIERLGGAAHVTAYASEDTYSSGPVHLRFDVTPGDLPVSTPAAAASVGGRS